MKSIIVPILIVAGLVIFFFVIDRKDFNRYNGIQTVQDKTTVAITKPASDSMIKMEPLVESHPVQSPPETEDNTSVEEKPLAETNPVAGGESVVEDSLIQFTPETKEESVTKEIVAEDKSPEDKAAPGAEVASEDKSDSSAEVASEDKVAPAAVPVVSAEDAAELNDFAIFLLEAKTTVVEGEIIERSELPDPEKSDYPNCRFTAHFRGNAIKSGEACPKEISLIIDGFTNYSVLDSNKIKKGDRILCSILPFDNLPEDEQSTQQADDLQLFLLESYYMTQFEIINDFTESEFLSSSGISFSGENEEYKSIFEQHINPPIPRNLQEAQQASIQKDFQKAKELLEGFDDKRIEEINNEFAKAWEKEKQKDPAGYNRFRNNAGEFVWRKIDNSFWALPVDYTFLSSPDLLSDDTLDCFAALKKACEANGVQLIVLLIPNCEAIASRVMNKEFRDIPDIQTASYVKQLSEAGIECFYASDRIIQNYNRFPFAYMYPRDAHPGDTAQDIVSDILCERLQRYSIKQDLNPTGFSISHQGYPEILFPSNCDIGDNKEKETIPFRAVYYSGPNGKQRKDAEIMIIGNSFSSIPNNAAPSLVSYKMKTSVDIYRMQAYGPFSEILLQLLSRPRFFLENKKVLVMYVGTEHMYKVNRAHTMVNVSQIDADRLLLNKKTMKGHYVLSSDTDDNTASNPELWGPLSFAEKTVYKINREGEWRTIIRINQDGKQKIDISDSEPIICVIPQTCVPNTSCTLTVNGTSKLMRGPSDSQNSRMTNLSFELPAGTKNITIRVEGKPGTFIAIKDIQIWQ